MYDFAAVREAVINAIVHNDWSNEYAPKFEMFSDRLVISSNGGIQPSTTKKEFLEGYSLPKNKELTETQKSIINLMFDSPTITQETLSKLLGISIRTIQRNIKVLIDLELIERTGATKKGEWIVK